MCFNLMLARILLNLLPSVPPFFLHSLFPLLFFGQTRGGGGVGMPPWIRLHTLYFPLSIVSQPVAHGAAVEGLSYEGRIEFTSASKQKSGIGTHSARVAIRDEAVRHVRGMRGICWGRRERTLRGNNRATTNADRPEMGRFPPTTVEHAITRGPGPMKRRSCP